jgi:hypothetical protein
MAASTAWAASPARRHEQEPESLCIADVGHAAQDLRDERIGQNLMQGLRDQDAELVGPPSAS